MWSLLICHSCRPLLAALVFPVHTSSVCFLFFPVHHLQLPSFLVSLSDPCAMIYSLLYILGGEVQVSVADPLDLEPVLEVVVSATTKLHLQTIDGLFLETATRYVCVLVETNAVPQAHLTEWWDRIYSTTEPSLSGNSKVDENHQTLSWCFFTSVPCWQLLYPLLITETGEPTFRDSSRRPCSA